MNLIANGLFLLVLFPYVSLTQTPYDTQPWALLGAVLFVLVTLFHCKPLLVPRPLFLLLLISLFAVVVYLLNSDFSYGLRSLAGYFSVFFLALVGFKTYKFVSEKTYISAVGIWFLVGIIQLLYHPTFGGWLLPRLSSGGTRGVTSLAVEPSFYAVVCIFLLVLNEFFYSDRKYGGRLYLVIAAVLALQVVLSFSALGIAMLFGFAGVKLISVMLFRSPAQHQRAALLVGVAMLLVFGAFLEVGALQNTRAGAVAAGVGSEPLALIYRDQSIADRGSHIALSFYSLVYSKGMGLGLGTWEDNAVALANSAGGWAQALAEVNMSVGGRVLSGWGTAIYELGVIGLLFIGTSLWILVSGIKRNRRMKTACAVSALVVVPLMVMAVPLAFPMFGYLLGVHMYYAYADPMRRAVADQATDSITGRLSPLQAGKVGGA